MEHRTEFDLENNIKTWKQHLTRKNNLTKSNVIELENHLLDLMDDLKANDLNEEEAFIIAIKRMGHVDDITQEFEKVNIGLSITNRITPYLKGALIYMAFIGICKMLLSGILFTAQVFNIENTLFKTLCVVLLVIISIVFFGAISFNLMPGKSYLRKLNKISVLVVLIVITYLLDYRWLAQVTLPGINSTFSLADYGTMALIFSIYKVICAVIFLAISLIFFWKKKKQDRFKLA